MEDYLEEPELDTLTEGALKGMVASWMIHILIT